MRTDLSTSVLHAIETDCAPDVTPGTSSASLSPSPTVINGNEFVLIPKESATRLASLLWFAAAACTELVGQFTIICDVGDPDWIMTEQDVESLYEWSDKLSAELRR